jgi:hypothetical protein
MDSTSGSIFALFFGATGECGGVGVASSSRLLAGCSDGGGGGGGLCVGVGVAEMRLAALLCGNG